MTGLWSLRLDPAQPGQHVLQADVDAIRAELPRRVHTYARQALKLVVAAWDTDQRENARLADTMRILDATRRDSEALFDKPGRNATRPSPRTV